jgi:5-methyltetrahydrofolate--homocysteine methyltransferase
MTDYIRQIAQYATVPVIAKPNAGLPTNEILSPQEFASQMKKLLDSGATVIGGCCQSTPEHIAQLRDLLQTYVFSSVKIEKISHPITLACETQPFFLEEDFEIPEPIRCSIDMADELIEMEDQGAAVIAVRLDTRSDAYHFSQNAHMARSPIVFVSDSEEALEHGLLLYNGCAIIDSRSEIDKDSLLALANGYGAIVI